MLSEHGGGWSDSKTLTRLLPFQAVMADVLLLDNAVPLSALANEYEVMSEDALRFLLAGAVVALEHLHKSSIIYRGLSHHTALVSKTSDNNLPGYIQVPLLSRYGKRGHPCGPANAKRITGGPGE